MLLPLAGALLVAVAIALAVQGIRERRATAADLRALREDLLRLSRALGNDAAARAGSRGRPPAPEHRERAGLAAVEDGGPQGRSSRTLH